MHAIVKMPSSVRPLFTIKNTKPPKSGAKVVRHRSSEASKSKATLGIYKSKTVLELHEDVDLRIDLRTAKPLKG